MQVTHPSGLAHITNLHPSQPALGEHLSRTPCWPPIAALHVALASSPHPGEQGLLALPGYPHL